MNKLDLSNTGERIFPKILRRQAQENGSTPFLVTEQGSISFAEAESITNRLAAGLQGLGVGQGDCIGLFMGNIPEMVLLSLAANKLGALWTPINTDYKGEWLLDALTHSRATVLAADAERYELLQPLLSRMDAKHLVLLADKLPAGGQEISTHLYSKLLEQPPLDLDYAEQDYGDTCAILWTSGTTGKSKGVLQSYNCWIRAIVGGCSVQFDSREGDIILCVLPLFNTAAWITCIYRALIEGLPCVLEEKFSVTQFWDRVKLFGATQTFALGAMGMFLLSAPEQADDADNTLRVAQIVPIPPDQWQVFEKRYGVKLIRSGMGQSECQLVTTQLENRDDVPVYALGFPLDDTELKLLDDNGDEVAPGETGEIAIKPLQPHILFSGYFENPEATAAAYRGEWYLTGDLASQDPASGAYFYKDRKKDAVRFAGRNISTLEVESVIRRHPAVQDVAAFGIASAQMASEQELKLDIVLREAASPSPEELCQFINDNAPHYFVPRYMEFVDALPYTPTNKVQKYLLRDKGVGDHTWDLKTSNFQVRR